MREQEVRTLLESQTQLLNEMHKARRPKSVEVLKDMAAVIVPFMTMLIGYGIYKSEMTTAQIKIEHLEEVHVKHSKILDGMSLRIQKNAVDIVKLQGR